MARFALLSDEDMAKLYENSQNKNTKRSTNNWISIFKTWANVRGKNSNIEDYVEAEAYNTLVEACNAIIYRMSVSAARS